MLKLLCNTRKIPKHFVMVVIALMIASCGDAGNEDSLPVDAWVDISPVGKQWSLSGDPPPPCLLAGPFHNSYHTVSVKNGSRQTLLNVPVTLSMDLSAANFTGFIVLQLFVDENRNNIPETAELVSDNLAGAYDTTTSDTNGTIKVIVRMNLSCRYGGALVVQAGSVSGSAPFEVTE